MAPDQEKAASQFKRIVAYACAVVLPVLATLFTVRTPELHGIPFALSFTIICALGALAGFGPALAAILVSSVSLNLPFSAPLHSNFATGQFLRSMVFVAGAFFITLLSWKQRSTERRLRSTLDSLRERTDALTQVQQASELATWVFDARTTETLWDEGSTQVFGRPFAELKGKPLPLDFVFPDDRQILTDAVTASTHTGQPLRVEYRVVWPNGDIHWLESRGTQVPCSPGLWRGATFDITRRKTVEAALVHSEKLAAVGRLASTIAHEVNNPLESVTNLLYLIDKDHTLNPITRSYLTLAEQELSRLSNITRLTLTFARSTSIPIAVDVAETCDSVLTIYRHRCDLLAIRVDRNYTPRVEIDIPPHELRQILINLIANAIDAAQGNAGILRIEISIAGNQAILLVEDNGHGIRPSHQTRIFEAFFTTKADMGTGIGLWVTREIVEKNGGAITVESGDLDHGMRTRFRLSFPLASPKTAEVLAEPAQASASNPASPSPTALN
ncbi:ATP-binding protein [Edaphobacter aggregans]|uniref:ATP-binding protein n=1 Tax=Edaphobacter aggregans TaxID=570835 RepID=UPI00068D0A9B|nr:ATP-binding protein [Edaphobacter aggregans]